MISDELFPLLMHRFPRSGVDVQREPCPTAIFPSAHPSIGAVTVTDEDDEITITIQGFTHSHYNRYGDELSERERVLAISEEVTDFLAKLFSDRVLLYRNVGDPGGGCRCFDPGEQYPSPGIGVEYFVWSGPCH